tara:strand:+ start:9023 stop:9241 length:219 start_codon:yes stop_codon:yes gene_type:complete
MIQNGAFATQFITPITKVIVVHKKFHVPNKPNRSDLNTIVSSMNEVRLKDLKNNNRKMYGIKERAEKPFLRF